MNTVQITIDDQPDIGDTLDPVLEVNDDEISNEQLDSTSVNDEFKEIPPKIFGLIDIKEPITIESLNNAIYELGVINLCWPDIKEPVFETRTCFPLSYYTNTKKEKLLLAYAENFRLQFQFHYESRKPLFLQAPNECGLQKMVCTSIRPTKLCFPDTNTWQGVASLVTDYFDYEPIRKPMLQIVRKAYVSRLTLGDVLNTESHIRYPALDVYHALVECARVKIERHSFESGVGVALRELGSVSDILANPKRTSCWGLVDLYIALVKVRNN